jgi:uncharacterized membrane protein
MQAGKAAAKSGSTLDVACPTRQQGSLDIDCHPTTSATTLRDLNAQASFTVHQPLWG